VLSVQSQFQYLVPMHAGAVGAGKPLFLVAGMFGNVLNLSHLAHLLGEDRPFFALQARGLYGDQRPCDTFEEMAREYLLEVRRVQPNGPYLLGGFSGGGLIAFEMARQLRAVGEQVGALILLDTPIRRPSRFSLLNKIEMSWPRLRKEGVRFVANKLRERREWKREMLARENARASESGRSAQFQSQRVGDAFVRALATYTVPTLDIDATLFRPRLNTRFKLRDGRLIDSELNVLQRDNGWTPHVSHLTVVEVPGNHDSMVLEPNVRVLVSSLRRTLVAAQEDS
jgi:thioesterase domain-containing protein